MGRVSLDTSSWRKINDYLLELESAEDRATLLDLALRRVGAIIPFDCGAGLIDSSLRVLTGFGVSEAIVSMYNQRYRFKMPSILYGPRGEFLRGLSHTRWADYPNSEFYVDFAKPYGIGYDLSSLRPSGPCSLLIQRSPFGKGFSEREKVIIEILAPHINNLLSARKKQDQLAERERAASQDIRSCLPALSKREAQVAALLCDGLSAREIGTTLIIGRRTAESYIAHLYTKIGVIRKADAIRLIRARLGR